MAHSIRPNDFSEINDDADESGLDSEANTIKEQLDSLEKENRQTYVYKGEEFYKSGRHAVKKGSRSNKMQYEMVLISNPEIKRWVSNEELYVVQGKSND